MLTRIQYQLNDDIRLNYKNAPQFQGALMQRIDTAYAEILHISALKPYSQYIERDRDQHIYWVVQTLNDEAERKIINEADISTGQTIMIEKFNLPVEIIGSVRQDMTEEQLLAGTLFENRPRIVKIAFATPAAFKVNEKYQNYPTVRHILSSLMQKYDACDMRTEISDESVLNDLDNYISVIGYNLRSCTFPIGEYKIPSFRGTLTLKISGPQQLVNLTHLLLTFGTFSGVGIKTAMGMGAMKIIERDDHTYG